MRRFFLILLSISLLALMSIPVNAATSATQVDLQTMVQSDGTCQVTVTATLHLEENNGELYFPVPANAKSVMLGGRRASLSTGSNALLIDLSDYIGPALGDIPLSISYSMEGTVSRDDADQPQLQLPLLSGFPYPVDNFRFTVTLPGPLSAKPAFSSGYHLANVEQYLTWDVQSNTIHGSALSQLKDHETLTMSVIVPEGMFAIRSTRAPSLTFCYYAIGVCALLALGYWLITLRTRPLRRTFSSTGPYGYTAGELGCLLHQTGADLTMMVFSWAQMGYIMIQTDRNGRVLLHKRMDMGNERSAFERRCFQALFAKREVVDTSTGAYAKLRMRINQMQPDMRSLLKPGSGNVRIFRILSVLMSAFFGVCIGINLFSGAVLQWLFAIVLGLVGLLSGWYLHGLGYCLLLPNRRRVIISWIHMGIWLLLGLLAGQFWLALLACIVHFLVGLLAAFGGRRTEEGRLAVSQILGLRRYLKKLSSDELQQIQQTNPEFFHTMAPQALALGVFKPFVRHCSKAPLPDCSYLTTGTDAKLTAKEWGRLMAHAVESMDARYRQMDSAQILSFFRSGNRK